MGTNRHPDSNKTASSAMNLPSLDGASDWREFHVSRAARDRYDFEQALFATNGNAVFANFAAARSFAAKMNAQRDLAAHPEQAVKAGQINAMGLLDEVLHIVAARYRREKNPRALAKALEWLDGRIGRAGVDEALLRFTQEFPPIAVYQNRSSAQEYLQGKTTGTPNRHIALEEMLMLWLSNMNPALKPFGELFDDTHLLDTAYEPIMKGLRDFFDTQPRFGPQNQNLIDMLRAPAMAHPDSITAQLEFILGSWGYIAEELFQRLLMSLDFVKEEEKPVFSGPGPTQVPVYRVEPAVRRSVWTNRNVSAPTRPGCRAPSFWPRTRMCGSTSYPNNTSARFAASTRCRMKSLICWRVGASTACGSSACGNAVAPRSASSRCAAIPDAVASAYSLYAYDIAHDLGAKRRMDSLRQRAGQRGIRMASDMVPNHMAIDSRWVYEHPDWFLSLPHSPFRPYTFQGVNLSGDDRVGIYLEDHYYSKSDAAVVFKRVDHWTGSESYVYHGNDGTSTPWNDTAQLDYLQAEVREGVIQTILHVARQFPIIRFDAAMTLAKRHYQRLWFPEPGTGGDIPSRAEHGLTAEQFNAAFPEEFWREVESAWRRKCPKRCCWPKPSG
jgi:hypothetical protein